MIGGKQVVQGQVKLQESKDASTVESTLHWNDASGKPFLIEQRGFTFRPAPAPACVLLDFQSRLEAPQGPVTLDGAPEHAGVHFRPADSFVRKETVYLFPGTDTDVRKSHDLPWISERFVLEDKTYTVIQFNHPENPAGTKSSAYRDYGRLGMLPTATIPTGGSLLLR